MNTRNPELGEPRITAEKGRSASTRRHILALAAAPLAVATVTYGLTGCSSDSGKNAQPKATEAPTTAPPTTSEKEEPQQPKIRVPAAWVTDPSRSFAATPELRDKICQNKDNPIPPDSNKQGVFGSQSGAILTASFTAIQQTIGDRRDVVPNIAYVWPKESQYIDTEKTGTGYATLLVDPHSEPRDAQGNFRVGVLGGDDGACWSVVVMENNGTPEAAVVGVVPTEVKHATVPQMNALDPPIAVA